MSKTLLQEIVGGITDWAWPNLCLICDAPLVEGETHLCARCLYELPYLQPASFQDNGAAERFWGKIEFEKAASGFRYTKESALQSLLEQLKYKGAKELGSYLGRRCGSLLQPRGFFEGIDALVPVPLHPKRQKKRGYNQSQWIADGLAQVCGLPVLPDILCRKTANSTQTTKSLWRRWENSLELFTAQHAESYADKHLLLVDDVLTSGSTMEACGHALREKAAVRLSFFSLALA
jgi:ComF family protein